MGQEATIKQIKPVSDNALSGKDFIAVNFLVEGLAVNAQDL
jgi:hypothetical protein